MFDLTPARAAVVRAVADALLPPAPGLSTGSERVDL